MVRTRKTRELPSEGDSWHMDEVSELKALQQRHMDVVKGFFDNIMVRKRKRSELPSEGESSQRAPKRTPPQHVARRYVCSHCGEEFEKSTVLGGHVRTKHAPKPKVYECSGCGISFRSHTSLGGHLRHSHCTSTSTKASSTIDLDEDDMSERKRLHNEVIELKGKFEELQQRHTELQQRHTELQQRHTELQGNFEDLKQRHMDEVFERKRLNNEVIELKGNIRVFCRCRPLNQNELSTGSRFIIEFESSLANELQVVCSDSSKKQFKCDHVFRPEDNQEAVFAQTKPLVASVLDGYNVCLFAYGQTGTGKTFTMEGTPENRGVNYRTLEELFRISRDRGASMGYEFCVSMLEVYNERIRDLLVDNTNQPTKKLEIKEDSEGTVHVPGLIETPINRIEEMWELVESGSRVRSVASTSANELSSRSHCLLRVTVKGENLINGQRTRSQLWLVDLAGSQSLGRIDVEGERLKESQFIRTSLFALGCVISSLASKTAHIPYRNSKLTHMLQSSLGGDCKTLMFVQISPSASDFGETLCSLDFARRVREIENGPACKQADLTEKDRDQETRATAPSLARKQGSRKQ